MGGADATTGQDSFTTAPSPGNGTVRFIAFGDSGVGSAVQSQLAARMTADTFDLALHTGDVAYGTSDMVGGPSYTQYDNWLFGIYPWMRSHPFYPSIGNHDDEINHASAYRDVFVLPEQGASTTYPDNAERYYSFDYGPIHFVALDTEFALLDPGRQQAQLAWLDADLAATTQPWRVVYFHRSPYSSGSEHGSALDVRQAFSPILERRGVQLVLSGHDHDFERSIPWRQFVSSASGITYVVTGGGGAALYAVGSSAWTAKSASVNHYMRVTVSGCTMTIEAVGVDGAVFDQASINRCSAGNQPPQVSLTAPQGGVSLAAASNLSISATANDSDGSINRVEFYAGTTLLNTDTTAPYAYTWLSVPAGTSIFARSRTITQERARLRPRPPSRSRPRHHRRRASRSRRPPTTRRWSRDTICECLRVAPIRTRQRRSRRPTSASLRPTRRGRLPSIDRRSSAPWRPVTMWRRWRPSEVAGVRRAAVSRSAAEVNGGVLRHLPGSRTLEVGGPFGRMNRSALASASPTWPFNQASLT